MSDDNPLLRELRDQIHDVMRQNAALRDENAWQKRWIAELRETVAALTHTNTSESFTHLARRQGS